VGHHQAGHLLQLLDVVSDPGHSVDVQVVGGLIEQQHVGVCEHGSGEGELHPPATRQGLNGAVHQMVREAHSAEALLDVGAVLVGGLHLGVVEHVVHAGGVGVVGLDAVLHVDRAQLGGEALQGAVGNGDHERGLARAVGAHQAVLAPLLQVQARLVQQHARGEGEGELVVAQVLLVVVVVLLRLLHHHEAHNHLVDHSGGLVGGDELSQVGQQVGCPVGRVVVLAVNQVVRNDRHVGNHILVTGNGVGVLEDDLGHLGLHLLHSHHGLLLLQGVTHDTVQGSKRPLAGVADLLNGHFVNAALEHGLNDGVEDSSVTRVIDQLAHAVVLRDSEKNSSDGEIQVTFRSYIIITKVT